MDKINLNKQVFDKKQYEKVIDTKFNQLVLPVTSSDFTQSISVQQFFQYYDELFYVIPKVGDTNSHEYLVKTSSEYIDFQQNNEDIQALIDEVTLLRQENLDLTLQLTNTLTGSITIPQA